MSGILALDLGGTAIKSAMLTNLNTLVQARSTPTPQGDPSAKLAIAVLSGIIAEYMKENEVGRVGLVIPGLVDAINGISIFSGTLGWRNVDFAGALSAAAGVPVYLDHDVTAAGLAELKIGASAPYSNSVLVQIGTGIASAIVIDGQIYRPHGVVGEIGHAPIGSGKPCPCGLRGCLEMSASGGAITRAYFAQTGKNATPLQIFERAQGGEVAAGQVWQEMIDALALSFAWLASTLAPEAIILGGGIAQAGKPIADAISTSLDSHLSIHRKPEILISTLADQAACLGAGFMARARE